MIEAADGQAGVEKAKAERPDLILMDIQMPVLNGYGDNRRRLEIRIGLDLLSCVVSSFAMKGDEEKSSRLRLRQLRDQAL